VEVKFIAISLMRSARAYEVGVGWKLGGKLGRCCLYCGCARHWAKPWPLQLQEILMARGVVVGINQAEIVNKVNANAISTNLTFGKKAHVCHFVDVFQGTSHLQKSSSRSINMSL